MSGKLQSFLLASTLLTAPSVLACVDILECVHPEAAITQVYVFDSEYSVNAPPGPIVDAVVSAGDTIDWTWSQAFTSHTVTNIPGSSETYDSGFLNPPSGAFSHTFNTPGVHTYFCQIHGFYDSNSGQVFGMGGTVTVQEVPEPAAMGAITILSSLLVRRRR